MGEGRGHKVEEENSSEGFLLERSPGTAGGKQHLILQPQDLGTLQFGIGNSG